MISAIKPPLNSGTSHIEARRQDVEETREESHGRADGGADCVTLLQWGALSHRHLRKIPAPRRKDGSLETGHFGDFWYLVGIWLVVQCAHLEK